MISVQDVISMLELFEANYGQKFYDGVDKKNVIKLWAADFKDDEPRQVMNAVMDCINTMQYKPTIADVRKRMAQAKMQGQMTSMEAFHAISKVVGKAYDRESATKLYNEMPPILQALVGFPSQLISWRNVDDSQFQTVIMSAIRESYREHAQREEDYYALPEQLQKVEKHLIKEQQQEALPEPVKQESYEEWDARLEMDAHEYRQKYNIQIRPGKEEETEGKKAAFVKPITADDMKRMELREQRRFDELAKPW